MRQTVNESSLSARLVVDAFEVIIVPYTGRVSFSWDQALTGRMRRHYLIERAPADMLVAVVDRLSGLHAQLMSSVDLALWARVDGLTQDAVADALWRQRTLVKMWTMRATLHVLPAANLSTWTAGFRIWKPGVAAEGPAGGAGRSLHREIAAGKILTRKELAAAVATRGVTLAMVNSLLGHWSASLRHASLAGSLCFAPNDGQQARFTQVPALLDPKHRHRIYRQQG